MLGYGGGYDGGDGYRGRGGPSRKSLACFWLFLVLLVLLAPVLAVGIARDSYTTRNLHLCEFATYLTGVAGQPNPMTAFLTSLPSRRSLSPIYLYRYMAEYESVMNLNVVRPVKVTGVSMTTMGTFLVDTDCLLGGNVARWEARTVISGKWVGRRQQ